MKFFILLMACYIGFIVPVFSVQPASSGEAVFFADQHSLDEYLAYLNLNNPELSGMAKETEALLAEIPSVETLPDPTVGIGLFLSSVETRVGPQEQKLSIRQKIPWKGKLKLKGDILTARSQQSRAKTEHVRRELIARFKKIYADLFFLGQEIKSNKEHLEILGGFEIVLTTKYQNGLAPYANLIRVQLERDRLTDRIDELMARQDPVSFKLMVLMGVSLRNMERPLPVIPFPTALPESKTNPKPAGKIQNPQLDELSFKTHQQRIQLAIEHKKTLPDFQVGLDWIGTGKAIMPNTVGSGKDPVAISVSMNVPIWKKKYSAKQEAVAHRIEATEKRLQDKENQLTAELRTAHYKYEDAQRKVRLYSEQIIPKAEESLNVLLAAFESDKASYLDILDAERALLEFTLSLEKAKSNLFIARAEIERITN